MYVFCTSSLKSAPGPSCTFSAPALKSVCFSKEPWFLLLENVVRNQDLGSACAHCSWIVVTAPSSQSEEIRVHTDRCVYTYPHSVFIPCICVKQSMSPLPCGSSLPPLLSVTFHSNTEKPGPHHLHPGITQCSRTCPAASELSSSYSPGNGQCTHLRFICIVSGVNRAHFFLLPNNISWYGCTSAYLRL